MISLSIKKQANKLLEDAYSKYYVEIYRFCLSYLTKDIESVDDCVQETFLVLYNKYLANEDVKFVRAFLYKVAENKVKMRLRDLSKAQKQVSIDEIIHLPAENRDVEEKLSFEEYSKQISDALNENEQELFKLRYIEHYTLEEIAKKLNISFSAVGVRVHRLRKKLMIVLEDIIK